MGLYSENIQQASRFLFYSHDGLGLGHVRRNLTVARELAELRPDASVLVVTGSDEVESLGVPPHVGVLKLPGLRKVENGRYSARRLRLPGSEVRVLREKVLVATVDTFRPEVLLVDRHPFGIDGELGPALEIARSYGGQAVLGLRDVLDDPHAVDVEWRSRGIFERISAYYNRVLVYGQPDVLDPVHDYDFPEDVARMTSFCGYVVSATRPAQADGEPRPHPRTKLPRVLATAGGGEDGFPVLEAFVGAANEAGWQATVVAGPQCPPERVKWLQHLAVDAGVTFRRFVPSLPSELAELDALVCMGGYNTLAEAAASGVPTVCVPRVRPRREQLIRARAFCSRGLLRLVDPDHLNPGVLKSEVETVLETDRHEGRSAIDLGGGRRAALHLLELASHRAAPSARRRQAS